MRDGDDGKSDLLDSLLYHKRRYLASKENFDREKRSVDYHKSEYIKARSKLLEMGANLSKGLFDD